MLNPTLKKRDEYIENAEGYEVYSGQPDLELFLLASNLKPKAVFYEDDTVKAFAGFMDRLPESESRFALALSGFFCDMGIKLAPVIILNKLAEKGVKIPDSFARVFDRPDKIANYIYFSKFRSPTADDGFNNLSKRELSLLRNALQSLRPETLVKMQMKSRKIKTRDLIKMLRPKPKDKRVSEIYKAIIESRAKSDTLLSKRSQDDGKAVETFDSDIETMPLNMLIRNLRMFKRTKNPAETRDRILKRLMSIDLSEKVMNPFDFVTVAVEEPSLEVEMTALIRKFVDSAKLDISGKTAVLFDVSGSMGGSGFEDGFKNLVLLAHIFKPEGLYYFNTGLYSDTNNVLKLIEKGSLHMAKDRMRYPEGGTSLLESLEKLCRGSHLYDNIIVISDEVTWADANEIDDYCDATKGRRIIAVNPVKYEGTVFRDKFLALSSLDAKIMLYLKALVDWQGFKRWVIGKYLPEKC